MKLISVQDNILEFIPKRTTNMVILGTMASINARQVGNKKPESAFYYHSPHNRFWQVIWYAMGEKNKFNLNTIQKKKKFLEKHGVAMTNIVHEIRVSKKFASNPSDIILFEAQKNKRLKFKSVSKRFKKILNSKPVLFTCKNKKGIQNLIQKFQELNGLDDDFFKKVQYLASPTRCNPKQKSRSWKKTINKL